MANVMEFSGSISELAEALHAPVLEGEDGDDHVLEGGTIGDGGEAADDGHVEGGLLDGDRVVQFPHSTDGTQVGLVADGSRMSRGSACKTFVKYHDFASHAGERPSCEALAESSDEVAGESRVGNGDQREIR